MRLHGKLAFDSCARNRQGYLNHHPRRGRVDEAVQIQWLLRVMSISTATMLTSRAGFSADGRAPGRTTASREASRAIFKRVIFTANTWLPSSTGRMWVIAA